MKQMPEEKKEVQSNFEPGKISKEGFFGKDTRHIHDIVRNDLQTLSWLGVGREEVADGLQYFIDEGKRGLEGEVDLGAFTVLVRWDRGMMPCPFGEHGLYPKIVATVFSKRQKKAIRYSQLSVHMIRKHGFFGGQGSVFRLDPRELLEFGVIKTKIEKK